MNIDEIRALMISESESWIDGYGRSTWPDDDEHVRRYGYCSDCGEYFGELPAVTRADAYAAMMPAFTSHDCERPALVFMPTRQPTLDNWWDRPCIADQGRIRGPRD